jgi:hypothetical protein
MNQVNALDSTANANTGAASGGVTLNGGEVGSACSFDGGGGHISVPSSASLDFTTNALTLEAWVFCPATLPTGEESILRKDSQWSLEFQNATTIRNLINTTGASGWTVGNDATYAFQTNTWYYFSFIYNGANVAHLINAQAIPFNYGTGVCNGNIVPNSNPVYFDGVAAGYFTGLIDEIRISCVARSTNWIWACWLNQSANATFNSYGTIVSTIAGTPAIVNVGAANIQTNAADLVGNLITGSAPVTVVCYWGTNDGGTVASAWSTNTVLGTQTPGIITNHVTGLASSRTYYFRYYATNSAGEAWAGSTAFTTLGAPTVDNGGGAASVARASAQLRGTVLGGTPDPAVWIYWGATDGGTTPGSWNHVISLGQKTAGGFSANVAGLSPVQSYWYRCLASNSVGAAWASSSATFITTGPTTNGTFTFTGTGNWSDASKWDAMPINGDSVVINGNCTSDVAIPNLVNLTVNASQKLVVSCGMGNATTRISGDTITLSGDLSVSGTLVVPGDPSPIAMSGTATVATGDTNVYGSGTSFTSQFAVGDGIKIGSVIGSVRAIVNDMHLILYWWPSTGATGANVYWASGCGLYLQANNVTVPTGGSINSDGGGFPAQSGPGAGGTDGGWSGSASGAGYGGWGAEKIGYTLFGGMPYGSATVPTALGSGGGNQTGGSGLGGAGGGAIKILTAGTLALNGTISANGVTPAYAGGGSGGSVWLVANTLTGAGFISAAGGDGTFYSGGGGGRVVVAAASMPYTGTFSTAGGASALPLSYIPAPARPGTLMLPDNYSLTITHSIAFAPGTYHIPTLIVTGNAILECQSANDGNPVNGAGVVIEADSVRVDAGATISASTLGFRVNEGPGCGIGESAMSGCGGGGGHGGAGSASIIGGDGGGTYGSSNQPVSIGSGGGGGYYYSPIPTIAGWGGGAIKLKTTGDVTVNGTISADGGAPWTGASGGGAGGSIWIDCRKLYGSGTNSANGGAGYYAGGSGGGGRIALWFVGGGGNMFTGTNSVGGGAGSPYFPNNIVSGADGTIYRNAKPASGLVILFQ